MNIQKTVKRAKENDEDAVESLLKNFYPFILKQASKVYLSGYSMEDLIQIGYLSILKSIYKYDLDKNTNFVSYVTNAIRNNYYYLIRKQARNNEIISLNEEAPKSTNEIIELLEADVDVEEDILKLDEIYRLKQALNKISKEDREFILYVFSKNRGALKEYSKEKGINYNTCKAKKKKLLKKLKDML